MSFFLITKYSTSVSSAMVLWMISCTFPLEHSSTKSVLRILYIVEYDSMVLRNWFSSPCLPLNVGMLSSTSLCMSAPYQVMMGLCTVVISDTFGS